MKNIIMNKIVRIFTTMVIGGGVGAASSVVGANKCIDITSELSKASGEGVMSSMYTTEDIVAYNNDCSISDSFESRGDKTVAYGGESSGIGNSTQMGISNAKSTSMSSSEGVYRKVKEGVTSVTLFNELGEKACCKNELSRVAGFDNSFDYEMNIHQNEIIPSIPWF